MAALPMAVSPPDAPAVAAAVDSMCAEAQAAVLALPERRQARMSQEREGPKMGVQWRYQKRAALPVRRNEYRNGQCPEA